MCSRMEWEVKAMGIGNFNNPLEAKNDCSHLSICKELGINTNDCYSGANSVRRCNQGQYAQIILLSKILDRLPSQSE